MSAWFDLPVRDLADAMSFYEGLLGWTYRQMDESPERDYVMVEYNGELIGGLRVVEGPILRIGYGPIPYFTVENLNVTSGRVRELGGELVGDPVDLGPTRGEYQWIRDREGNLVGLWSSK